MATYAAMKPTKPGLEEPQEVIHKIRITLSSKNVKNLEKGNPFCFFYLHLLVFNDIIMLIVLFMCNLFGSA